MRTTPMMHQITALERMDGRDFYGLFLEQGTGKTWCLLADAERLFLKDKIDALLVIAPNGVHTNWVRREIPQHLDAPCIARSWKSGAGKKWIEWMNDVLTPRPPRHAGGGLRIFAINIDALITKAGFDFAAQFVMKFRAMMVVDESSRIKNPKAARSQAIMKLRPHVRYVRIATGTPVTNAPVDVFNQMEFLQRGLLGTTSHRAFVAEYAELLPSNHPMLKRMSQRNPRIAHAQIIARDSNGRPKWRNLGKLHRLLDPHTFRVTKDECLDLPAKIYKRHYFSMSPAQTKAYKLMEEECRMTIKDELVPVQALSAGIKLQQITSGFVLHEGIPHYVAEENPRLEALKDLIEDLNGPFIVWARFKEEIRAIINTLKANQISAAPYFGDTSTADREVAIDDFQSGRIRAFIGQQQAAGLGLTLTAAETAIYYSNDFNLEHRSQSEDRCHRKGTRHSVVYIDLIAEGSIDETIATALQSKSNMARAIVGDLQLATQPA